MGKDKLMVLCVILFCLQCMKGHASKSDKSWEKSSIGLKTKSAKTSKGSKQSKQGRYYCEQVGAGHYECPLHSFNAADERVADEMVELCEKQKVVEILRSYTDGSQIHVRICPAELKYLNNGIEFDRGISKIYLIIRRGGVYTFSGESLKQSQGEACDISYDCSIGLVCSIPSHQCKEDEEEASRIPSLNPTVNPHAPSSQSPSMDPSNTQTSPPIPIIVTKTPTVRPSSIMPSVKPNSPPSEESTTSTSTTTTTTATTAGNPTNQPTFENTETPSGLPSLYPSHHPTTISAAPNPIQSPSDSPSTKTSNVPSLVISEAPSDGPSIFPSSLPTLIATTNPSMSPSDLPSKNPSIAPSLVISEAPSDGPSIFPSSLPTLIATTNPSQSPSNSPSKFPSTIPSFVISEAPSYSPSSVPSFILTDNPSGSPTIPVSPTPTQGPTGVSNISCKTHDDCDECSTCNKSVCGTPSYGCRCDSNCPFDKPKCYHTGGPLGQCGCSRNDQCTGVGETCDYSCVIGDAAKLCETQQSRNDECEGINGPGYICLPGSTKCTNPPRPTFTPTRRPIRPR